MNLRQDGGDALVPERPQTGDQEVRPGVLDVRAALFRHDAPSEFPEGAVRSAFERPRLESSGDWASQGVVQTHSSLQIIGRSRLELAEEEVYFRERQANERNSLCQREAKHAGQAGNESRRYARRPAALKGAVPVVADPDELSDFAAPQASNAPP